VSRKSGLPIVGPEPVALVDRLEAAQLEYPPSGKVQVCSGSFLEFLLSVMFTFNSSADLFLLLIQKGGGVEPY
jgi:hypothetical protein